MDVADVTGIDVLFHAAHGRRKQEGVADHQNEAMAIGELDKLLSFSFGASDWFFDENMFADTEGGFGHLMVEADGSSNDQGVKLGIFQEVFKATRRCDFRIKTAHMIEARLTGVAQNLEFAILGLAQIADEVRSPITTSHDSGFNRFLGVIHR